MNTTNVRDVNKMITVNELGTGAYMVAKTTNGSSIIRIIGARKKKGVLQGKSLASGEWYNVEYFSELE